MDAHEIPFERRNAISLYPREVALDDPEMVDHLIKTIQQKSEDDSLQWLLDLEDVIFSLGRQLISGIPLRAVR
jgi:hypothetical protein